MSNILNEIDIDSSVEQTRKRRALQSDKVSSQKEMWNFVFEDMRDLVYVLLHNDIRCGTHRSPIAENLIHTINELIELNPHGREMNNTSLLIDNRDKGYKAPYIRFKNNPRWNYEEMKEVKE